MSSRQSHRGPHPQDQSLFTSSALDPLRRAVEEAAYLLTRGYPASTVSEVVGNRHQLRSRQRLALQRVACSDQQRTSRRAKVKPLADASGQELEIDGFNLIISLEVALSGGVLLRGRDGALRDLAGLRGSYRPVVETDPAIELIGRALDNAGVASARFLLDKPVSNSGRLAARIRELSTGWLTPVEVELVADPDRDLIGLEHVVSSDSLVIDRSKSWIDLVGETVEREIDSAWIVEVAA